MTPKSTNRRSWGRMPATAFADLKATLNSGIDVEIVNLSRGGTQFRTSKRMLPGLSVTLNLATSDGRMTMKGKVMRSSMVKLSDGSLGYEVGVAFDLELGTPGKVPAQARAEAAKAAARSSAPEVSAQPEPVADVEGCEPASAAAPLPSGSVIDAGIDRSRASAGRPVRPVARGGSGARRGRTPEIEILDPDPRNRVDVNADVTGQSLEGLLELLTT